jgi:hypothetical protein
MTTTRSSSIAVTVSMRAFLGRMAESVSGYSGAVRGVKFPDQPDVPDVDEDALIGRIELEGRNRPARHLPLQLARQVMHEK